MATPTVTINETVNRVTVAPDTTVTVQVVDQPTTVTVTAPGGGGGTVDLSGVEADIAAVESSVATVEDSVTTVASDVATVQSSVATVQDDVTAAQTSITNIERRVFDVHAYGATGNGTTNDRAAIQAAINAAAVAGGIVTAHGATYLIGSPGLVIPQDQQEPISIEGAMVGGTGSYGTTLIRDGAYPLISTSATGADSSDSAGMNHGLSLRNITLDGAATDATLVRLDRCAGVLAENVRLVNSGRAALHASQLLNSRFMACMFETSGNAPTQTPAVFLDAAGSETNTVQFIGCHWEGNGWTDLKLSGTAALPCVGILIMGTGKFERSLGYAVHFEHARYCVLEGCYLYTNSTNACVRYDTGNENVIVANHFTAQGTPTNPYLLHIAAGGFLTVTGNTFIAATSAHIRIDSIVDGPVTILGNVHRAVGSEVPISDARTNRLGITLGASESWLTGGTGHVEANINGVAEGQKQLKFRSEGAERWYVRANADAESGANAGSNFEIGAVGDDGSDLGDAVRIERATRKVRVIGPLAHESGLLGFYSAEPVAKPVVSGDRGNVPAVANLLAKLDLMGLIINATTEGVVSTGSSLPAMMNAAGVGDGLPMPDGTIDAHDRAMLLGLMWWS